MEIVLLIIGLFILFLLSAVIFLLYQKISRLTQNSDSQKSMELMSRWFEQMQARLDRNSDVLERGIRQTSDQVTSRLDKTGEMLGMVGQRIGEMSEIGRSMKDLGDLLKSPKLRGNIGEYILRDMLRQYLPVSSFSMQYSFRNGYIADAIIKTDNGIICVDSKFPFENFRKLYSAENDKDRDLIRKEFVRDVKKHIDAISAKYIVPEEQTVDYAIMYIPSESVYYEVISHSPDLLDYAHSKQVVVVSPSVFYAYLQVIMLSFEGKKVEEQARELMRSFKSLENEFNKFGDQFGLGVKHLSNARNAFDDAQSKYNSVTQKLQLILKHSETQTIVEPHLDELQR